MSSTKIVLLGAPGAGKGTQAVLLSKNLGVPHISTGDMLRAAVAAETPVGLEAKAVMDAGHLVSDQIVIGIAEERLTQDDATEGFILDGFPRTLGQAEALDGLLDKIGSGIDCCLAITVDTEGIVERLLKEEADVNAQNAKSQTPLNIASYSGHLDVVKLLLAARADLTPKDAWGDDALGNARAQGHQQIVDLLESALEAAGVTGLHDLPKEKP